MNKHITIALGIILCMGLFVQSFAATTEEMIEAFKNDAAVQAEVKNIQKITKWNQETFQVISLGGDCGVAGCSFRSLVVMELTRSGTNPQSTSVLAVVEGFNGRIKKVILVELKPKVTSSF